MYDYRILNKWFCYLNFFKNFISCEVNKIRGTRVPLDILLVTTYLEILINKKKKYIFIILLLYYNS